MAATSFSPTGYSGSLEGSRPEAGRDLHQDFSGQLFVRQLFPQGRGVLARVPVQVEPRNFRDASASRLRAPPTSAGLDLRGIHGR